MNEYLFILGNTPDLAKAEIETVLKREKISFAPNFSSREIFHLQTENHLPAADLIKTLGGTVKIAEVEGEIGGRGEGRLVFGVSGYGGFSLEEIKALNEKIKENLKLLEIKSRYILPQKGTVLSSVVVAKQKVLDINVVKEETKLVLAKTICVQDFEDWGKRDFGRPWFDPKKGMLPPKVARMMANLAISTIQDRNKSVATILDRKAVLDPFCGVGTILMEGMMIGASVLGSDISETMLNKTRKNLSWLKENYPGLKSSFRLLKSDATHISESLDSESIDAIVSEGYLGPAKLPDDKKKIENIVKGLDRLYLGCLSDWRKILKIGGRIVFCLPEYRLGKDNFSVKKPLDTCEKFGYTLLCGPITYSRPQAIVARKIYILKKSS